MLKRLIFLRVGISIGYQMVAQHTVEAACLSRQRGKVFSVICSVLSTLQYLPHVSVRSSSSILAVRGKQSTVATLETRERVWGGEGCWFGGEWFSLYMKTLHFLSLAQINTAKNSNIHEPVTSQPHFTKWLKKKKKILMQPHTLSRTLTNIWNQDWGKTTNSYSNKIVLMAFAVTIFKKHSKESTTHIDWLKTTQWVKSVTGKKEEDAFEQIWQLLVFNKLFSSERIKNQIIDGLQKLSHWRFWWRTISERKKHWCGFVKKKKKKEKNLNKVLLLKQTSSVWGIKEKSHQMTQKNKLYAITLCTEDKLFTVWSVYPHT